MIKKILITLLLLPFLANAQDTLRVKLVPNNGYKWMMLYKVSGAKQQYIADTKLKDGEFELVVPKGKGAGMYRLFYSMENNGFLDFIYNNEPISVSFNANLPQQTAKFEKSEENKIYQSYLNAIYHQQSKIDSLQMAYFNAENKLELKQEYTKRLKSLTDLQNHFETTSKGKIAQEFIKVNRKYNAPEPLETPGDYLKMIETHFFDNINFDNKVVLNSSVFVDKVMEYVFYINSSEDAATDRELKKASINQAISKIGANDFIKSEVLSSLLYAFSGQEAVEMVKFVKEKHYDLLPSKYKDAKFISSINEKLKVVVGKIAPEITWKEGDKTLKLSELEGSEKYIITFWSTSCSHCLKEIPKLYEFTKDLENVKVIAVALENDYLGFEHHTKGMEKWVNILGLNKFKNEIAVSYDIHFTPNYFVLDKDKKITAKPEKLEELFKILGKE